MSDDRLKLGRSLPSREVMLAFFLFDIIKNLLDMMGTK